jgi:hypothetical protein
MTNTINLRKKTRKVPSSLLYACFFCCLGFFAPQAAQAQCPTGNILYVNDDAGGSNDGTSWANAFTNLQSALFSTCPGITEIWVAQGIYMPSDTARADAFIMKNNLAILGGFPNTGNPGIGDRNTDPLTNGTVLSGEIGAAGNGDNSFNVIRNTVNNVNSTAVLDGFTITGGNANDFLLSIGGGMYNNYSNPTVTNCSFSGNSAEFGGGMYNIFSSPTIENTVFYDNSAYLGGGMYNTNSSSPTIENTAFNENSAEFGGGMYNRNSASPTIGNTAFNENSAGYGGGMYNYNNSSPMISNSTFSNNTATNDGGGMLNNFGSFPILTDCSFSGNSASEGGGGMFNRSSSPTVTNCLFSGNSVSGAIDSNGGGMYNGSGSVPKVINCSFLGNFADDLGGGMYNAFSSPTVTNCSFSGNSASEGGGMLNFGATFNISTNITNCILWGNSSGIQNNTGSNTIVTYSIVQQPSGVYPGTGNLNVDPLFVSQPPIGLGTSGDLRLQGCSQAIDVGDDSANATSEDLGGNDRTLDAIPGNPVIDLGAYEFQGTVPIPMASCRNITVVLTGNSVTINPEQVDGGSLVECSFDGLFFSNVSPNTFDCTDVGPQLVTLTITASNGFSDDCQATVTVQDNNPLTIDCPADATVQCGDATDPSATGSATSDGACGTPTITFDDNITPSCGNTEVITRTWTVMDDSGSTECTQIITVVDNTAPVVNCDEFAMTFEGCPGPLGANIPNGVWFAIGVDGGFTAASGGGGPFSMFLDLSTCITDECSDLANLEYTLADSYEEDRTNCSVTLINEFSVRDECGNVAGNRIITRFTIENTSDAMITCPAGVDITCGSSTDPADTGMATATDACGNVPVTFSDEITMRCNDGSYVIIRTWTATGCGTPATCEQFIFLRDEEAPMFDLACQIDQTFTTEDGDPCPADATISLTEGDELAVNDTWTVGGNAVPSLAGCVSDNCALDEEITVTVDDITITGSGTCMRTIAVTFIADDGCGNDSEPFTLSYIFIDNTIPVFDAACQINQTFTTETGSVCPADATFSLSEGDQFGVNDVFSVGGNTQPTLAGCITDNCGLEDDFIITVDNIDVTDNGTCSRTIAVTFIADDGCGNDSEPFTFNYTFLDDTAPVFDLSCQIDAVFTTEDGNVCPADATISLNEGDVIDASTGWTVGGVPILPLGSCVGDNCTALADVDITVDDITITGSGTCMRTITVTFIADDGCGNFSDPFVCNYTFLDDTAPVFDLACQLDIVFTTEDGNVCPADATISLNEGDVIDASTGWTVGGVPILPLGSCVGDNCTALDDVDITVDDITVVDDGTCSRVITITFIADDGCGNFSEPFVCNYTFIDNTGPEVSFNGIPDGGTYVIECDLPSTTWDPLIDFNELDISDVCSDVDFSTLTEVLTQLYDGPCVGNLLTRWQQVFTVEDVCGNETVYTLFTEIIDTTPPVFTSSPADVTIECDETAPLPELEAFDSCSEVIYGFTEVRTDGSCPHNYRLTRTWTATDGCGNASSEVQIVTVEDTTAPKFEFIDEYIADYEPGQNVFVECSELGNISQVIANNAVATDNCSGNTPVTYTLEDLGSFNCLEFGYSGAFISTWTSTDECGNTATATINWFLVDETAPVFQGLPEDTCADADNLPPVADVQAVDDCELAALTFSQSDPIDCEGGGQYIERTWNAEDACGNSASHTQRITLGGANGLNIVIDYPEIGDVEDGDMIQLPIDCDQDIAFSLEDLEAAISVSDGCGAGSGQSTIEINLMDEGDCSQNGYLARYQVNVSATDACGNAATLGVIIDFVDQTGPVVSGDAEITLICGDEIPMIEATDACGEIASMTFVDSAPIEVSCAANPVAYDRTWTVTDACGNATTFTQSIIVIDNAGPVFSGVPADMCNNTGIDVVVTAIDGCTGQQAQVSFDEEMSNEAGCGQVLTRTWTATDACGNTSTATQQVFFDDEVAPSIAFTGDLVFGLESGDELFINVGDGFGDPNEPLFLTAADVTVTDNCATITAQVVMETTISGDCAADGYLARYDYKFIATDPCGNVGSAILTVFYRDANAPDFFNVPDYVEVFCAAIPAVADVTASDDYDEEVEVIFSETQIATPEGVLITRTWTATDKCGNTNAVSQEILVVNNDISATFSFGSPVIECNSDNNRLGVSPSGGTPPYTYQWQLTFPLEDGYITTDPTRPAILFTMGYITQTFTVNITDANGCEYAASVTVVCDFSDDEGDFFGNGNDGSISLNVYPNPVSDQLMVKANVQEDIPVMVALYNLFGQELFRTEQDTWAPEGLRIDTRRFPNGTYLLRLTADGHEVQTREVVILH